MKSLLIGNNVTGTEHPMILRAIEHFLAVGSGTGIVKRGHGGDEPIRTVNARSILLSDVVAEYTRRLNRTIWCGARQSTMATDGPQSDESQATADGAK